MEATHKISVVFFPKTLELELTWEDIETGENAKLTTKVSDMKIGIAISNVVPPCVYCFAVVKKEKDRC